MVWARTILLHLLQTNTQSRIELWVVDVTYHIVQARFKICPSRLAEVARVFRLGGCLPALLAKLFRTHRRAADSENFELRVHAALACQVVKAREQVRLPQITRSPKNNQNARISDGQSFLRQLLDGVGLDNRRHKVSLYLC